MTAPVPACRPILGARVGDAIVVLPDTAARPASEDQGTGVTVIGTLCCSEPCICTKEQVDAAQLRLIRSPDATWEAVRRGGNQVTILLYDPTALPIAPVAPPGPPDTLLAAHFAPSRRDRSASPSLTTALEFLATAHGSDRDDAHRGTPAPVPCTVVLEHNRVGEPLALCREYARSTFHWLGAMHTAPTSAAALSGLWLAINDRILGTAFAAYLLSPGVTDVLAPRLAAALANHACARVHATLTWFMSWPAGLKLNNAFARFLGELGQWVVLAWDTGVLQPLLRAVTSERGLAALATLAVVGGVSLLLAVVTDLLALLTAHLHALHHATARLFAAQRRALVALLALFLGKQHNPLRRRVETATFSAEQLLMATLLFTVLAFLAPTALVFYAYFEAIHLARTAAHRAAATALVFLHSFPLFTLTVRTKEPARSWYVE
ncbi:pig-Q [Blastocladiella emersonii ATCC 22665]|nr:pig-Q [Blastocladiella emersonii ATCC 22665]